MEATLMAVVCISIHGPAELLSSPARAKWPHGPCLKLSGHDHSRALLLSSYLLPIFQHRVECFPNEQPRVSRPYLAKVRRCPLSREALQVQRPLPAVSKLCQTRAPMLPFVDCQLPLAISAGCCT